MFRIYRIKPEKPEKCPGCLSLDVKGNFILLNDLNSPFSHRPLLCLLCFLW